MNRNVVNETIQAGYQAINSLEKAKNELNTARNWGVIDIMGGGLLSGLVKHSKMGKARDYITEAEYSLRIFNDYMISLKAQNINLNTTDLYGFMDVFFDGLFSDFLMQSRINEARSACDRTIMEIRRVLAELEYYRDGE